MPSDITHLQKPYEWLMGYGTCIPIDCFQISIKWPDSKGQTHDEEVAVKRNFHFKRISFFYSGKDLM